MSVQSKASQCQQDTGANNGSDGASDASRSVNQDSACHRDVIPKAIHQLPSLIVIEKRDWPLNQCCEELPPQAEGDSLNGGLNEIEPAKSGAAPSHHHQPAEPSMLHDELKSAIALAEEINEMAHEVRV